MTRLELANRIADILNRKPEDISGRVWGKTGKIRVYVRKQTGGKRGWIEAGYYEILASGKVEVCGKVEFELRYVGKEEIAEIKLLPSAEPEVVAAPAQKTYVKPAYQDEDVAAFEQSERVIGRSESAREIG